MTFAAAKFGKFLPVAAFAMTVEFLTGVVASVIAGHIVGEAGLSAVSLMQPVLAVVSFVSMIVGTGTGVLYAKEMGRFDRRRASELLTQGLWCSLALGGLLVLAMALLKDPVLDSFGASPAVRALADEYWLWYLASPVLEVLAFFMVCLCSADGNPRICTLAYSVQLAVNCTVSVFLTSRIGIAGCAVGTAVGALSAVAVLSLHFFSQACSLRFVRHFSFRDSGRIVACAAGDASVRMFQAMLFYVLNVFVISKFGSDRLPVLAAATTVLGLSEALDAVPMAAQPLVGVYLGERNGRLVRRVMGYAGSASVAIGAAATLVLAVFPQLAVKAVGISDAALCADAAAAVRVVSVGLAGTALLVLYNSYCMCISKTALAALVSFLSAFAVPAAMLLPLGVAFGEMGAWAALGVSPFVAMLAVSAVVVLKWGRNAFPLFIDRDRMRKLRVYDLVVDEKSVCEISDLVRNFLAVRTDARRASLTALLMEEALMTVHDRNGGRRIRAELTIDFSDGLVLVIRDDGKIFDITDADARATSFRAYFVSTLMAAIPVRRNMTTTSFNRNVFRIEAGA